MDNTVSQYAAYHPQVGNITLYARSGGTPVKATRDRWANTTDLFQRLALAYYKGRPTGKLDFYIETADITKTDAKDIHLRVWKRDSEDLDRQFSDDEKLQIQDILVKLNDRLQPTSSPVFSRPPADQTGPLFMPSVPADPIDPHYVEQGTDRLIAANERLKDELVGAQLEAEYARVQVAEKSALVDRLTLQLREAGGRNAELEAALEQATQDLGLAQGAKESADQDVARLESLLQRRQERIQRLQAVLDRQAEQHHKVVGELRSANQTIDQLEGELDRIPGFEAEIQSLRQQLAQAKDQHAQGAEGQAKDQQLNDKLAAAERELERLRGLPKELRRAKQERDALKGTLAEMSGTRGRLEQRLADEKKKREALKGANRQQQDQLAAAEFRNKKLQSQIAQQEEVQKRQEVQRQLRQAGEQAELSMAHLTAAAQKAQKMVQLQEKIRELEAENGVLRAPSVNAIDAEHQLEGLRADLAALQEQHQHDAAAIADKEALIDEQHRVLQSQHDGAQKADELRAELEELRKAEALSNQSALAAGGELKSLREQHEALKDELTAAQFRLADQQQQIQGHQKELKSQSTDPETERRVQGLRIQLEDRTRRIAELEHLVQVMKKSRAELAQAKIRLQQLNGKLDGLRHANHDLVKENAGLEKSAKGANQLKRSLAASKRLVDQESKGKIELEAQVRSLQQELDRAHASNRPLADVQKEADARVHRARAEASEAAARADHAEAHLEHDQDSLAYWEKRVRQTEAKLAQAEQALAAALDRGAQMQVGARAMAQTIGVVTDVLADHPAAERDLARKLGLGSSPLNASTA